MTRRPTQGTAEHQTRSQLAGTPLLAYPPCPELLLGSAYLAISALQSVKRIPLTPADIRAHHREHDNWDDQNPSGYDDP